MWTAINKTSKRISLLVNNINTNVKNLKTEQKIQNVHQEITVDKMFSFLLVTIGVRFEYKKLDNFFTRT